MYIQTYIVKSGVYCDPPSQSGPRGAVLLSWVTVLGYQNVGNTM